MPGEAPKQNSTLSGLMGEYSWQENWSKVTGLIRIRLVKSPKGEAPKPVGA